jgi:hypothetical protein
MTELAAAVAALLLLVAVFVITFGRWNRQPPAHTGYVPGLDLILEDKTEDEPLSPAVVATYELIVQLRAEGAPIHLIDDALETLTALTKERAV